MIDSNTLSIQREANKMAMNLTSIEETVNESRNQREAHEAQQAARADELKKKRGELAIYVDEWRDLFDRIVELDKKGPPLLSRLDGLNELGGGVRMAELYSDSVVEAIRNELVATLGRTRMLQSLAHVDQRRVGAVLAQFGGSQ
jgi:hypothetical protein